MSSTIVRLADGTALAIGSPGARRIASIVGVALARHCFRQIPLQESISRGRFHAEHLGVATFELDRLAPAAVTALAGLFPTIEAERQADYYGPCTAIRRDGSGTLTLGLDDRWEGFGTVIE